MNTDKLFHEYFQAAPQAVFELLQLQPACQYQYTSPVVKAAERRLDGFLEPLSPDQPYYFVEIQGYSDPMIYWRGVSQLGLYHQQNQNLDGQNWKMIFFFLDEEYDPGPKTLGPLYPARQRWLYRKVLPKVLNQIVGGPPILNVLRPLATDDIQDLEEQGEQWVQEIRNDQTLDAATEEKLISLLVQFVAQKFVTLTRKEIDQMLKLTPFEETTAGKEYIEEGVQQGRQEGLQEGVQQGLQQGIQQTIVQALGFRFSQISQTILEYIEKINDPDRLRWLFNQTLAVDSLTQFEQILQEEASRS